MLCCLVNLYKSATTTTRFNFTLTNLIIIHLQDNVFYLQNNLIEEYERQSQNYIQALKENVELKAANEELRKQLFQERLDHQGFPTRDADCPPK